MRHPRGRVALAAVLALAAGCGGESGDLLAVEITGGPAGGELRQISSERLIEAREVERDLEDLAEDGTDLGGEATGDRRAYVARTQAGTVRWVEAQTGNPTVLPRIELLSLQLGRDLCA